MPLQVAIIMNGAVCYLIIYSPLIPYAVVLKQRPNVGGCLEGDFTKKQNTLHTSPMNITKLFCLSIILFFVVTMYIT